MIVAAIGRSYAWEAVFDSLVYCFITYLCWAVLFEPSFIVPRRHGSICGASLVSKSIQIGERCPACEDLWLHDADEKSIQQTNSPHSQLND